MEMVMVIGGTASLPNELDAEDMGRYIHTWAGSGELLSRSLVSGPQQARFYSSHASTRIHFSQVMFAGSPIL
jgi:hypothetical protein